MDRLSTPFVSLHTLSGPVMRSNMDSYKVDEGYSEDTRSQDGSERSIRLDSRDMEDSVMQLQPPLAANLEGALRGLSEFERSEIAYDILRGLRASSIASVFDRLWPLFHKDPLEAFPAEIMSLVLQLLEPQDLLKVSLISRSWRSRVTDSNLWKEKFSYEGWGLDMEEIDCYERRFTQISNERSRFAELHSATSANATGKQKPTTEELMRRKDSQRSPQDNTRTIADQGGDVDDEMYDTDTVQAPSPLGRYTASPYSPARITHQSAKSHNTSLANGRQPLMMVSTAWHPRINYQYIYKQKRRLEDNWDKGRYKNFQLPHRDYPTEAHEECVYTLQYQGNFLVSGSRDRTLRIWNLETGRLAQKPLRGHLGSVLCLQFDSSPEENIIISGSSDTSVILWRFSTGEMIKKIEGAHRESVLNLRFDHRFLVTCSKDKTIKIWNRQQLRPGDTDYPIKGLPDGGECPSYILDAPRIGNSVRYQPTSPDHLLLLEPYMHLMTLSLHGAAVNAIQIYNNELVSASGDRNLRIWDIHTGECRSKIQAHEKGIACVQYDGRRIVSGSSDNSIRIWDPYTKTDVARLEGHTRLVRTLQAAFADVPGGRERLEAEAQEVDRQWEVAKAKGEDLRPNRPGRPARPGSRRPRDLRTRGAKIPPSGGGSKWGRIISGSYDEKVIIWKKNADDEWVVSHQLAQEEALTAAGPPLSSRAHAANARPAVGANQARTLPALRGGPNPLGAIGDPVAATTGPFVSNEPTRQVTPSMPGPANNPAMSMYGQALQSQTTSPEDSHAANGSANTANQSTQIANVRTGDIVAPLTGPPTIPLPSQATTNNLPPGIPTQIHNLQNRPPNARPVVGQNGAPAGQPNARVFKLQFDSRRIICCSQDNKIVGWDFANGDEDIEACSRFFSNPE